MGEDAMAAVQPAIRAPDEAVQRLVRVLHRPTIEYHARLAGFILGILRDEEQLGRSADPDAPVTDLDAADEVEAFIEHRRLTIRTVAQWVFQNQDAVLTLTITAFAGIGHAFDDPETALLVKAHRDRLNHPRLGGDERHLETLRHGHRLERFGRGRPLPVVLERHVDLRSCRRGSKGGNGGESRAEENGAHWGTGSVTRQPPWFLYFN